ncbi:hypothetical protein TNCV_1244411 [Trichonephila clavipes]|nr:hypothetical protein TNCV_1244411 [Trichonephila clavipes]
MDLTRISPTLLHNVCGRSSLVIKVTDSWPACHEFESSTAEDPPCRGRRCMLNIWRFKRPPVGVVWKLGEESVS